MVQILADREQLPVKQFEEEIMAAVDSSPVVIIRGATGCGKTTQVPQYILDRFVRGGRASDCNIVVTQVRSSNVCDITEGRMTSSEPANQRHPESSEVS